MFKKINIDQTIKHCCTVAPHAHHCGHCIRKDGLKVEAAAAWVRGFINYRNNCMYNDLDMVLVLDLNKLTFIGDGCKQYVVWLLDHQK